MPTPQPSQVQPGEVESELVRIERVVHGARDLHQMLGNDDGGVHFDIPSATISGGKRNFRANESVTIQGQVMAFKDPTLGTSIGVSLFPILPAN